MTTVAGLTRRRRSTAREPGWQRAYYRLITLGLVAAIGVPQLVRFSSWLFGGAGPADAAPGLALLLALLSGLLMLLAWTGPVVSSPADVRWLVLSPLNRRRVLTRGASVLLASSIVAGLILGSLGAAVSGGGRDLIAHLSLGVSVTVTAGAAGVLLQAAGTRRDWLRLTAVLLLVAAGALILLRPSLPGPPLVPAAFSAPVVATLLTWRAWRALAHFPSRVLLDASARMGTLVASSYNLEPAALTSIAEERFWRSRRLRSRPWPVTGRAATVLSDARMLSRRPGRLAVLAVLTVLPVLVRSAGGTTGLAVVVLVCGGLAAATTAAAGARWDAQHPELARLFARGSATGVVMPAALALLWTGLALALLVTAGFLPAWSCLFAPAAAPGLAVGALRMARRGPIDHSIPVVDLGMGGIPLGPVLWATAGVDIAILGSVPLLLAVTPASLALQALLGAVLLGVCVRRRRVSR
ncbi:DUF6297 family protein [Streptosporangium longisporum]|uniref:ABC transporter permease n=1 Tax=Streptosporangium longisporum TaxID=46187 RepID=A0ABP6LHX9_9ACTN